MPRRGTCFSCPQEGRLFPVVRDDRLRWVCDGCRRKLCGRRSMPVHYERQLQDIQARRDAADAVIGGLAEKRDRIDGWIAEVEKDAAAALTGPTDLERWREGKLVSTYWWWDSLKKDRSAEKAEPHSGRCTLCNRWQRLYPAAGLSSVLEWGVQHLPNEALRGRAGRRLL